MRESNAEVKVGRPPLPKNKLRNKRLVGMFSADEMVEISAHMDRTGNGPNDTVREAVLKQVREGQDDG